jgi:NAD(P)-dependent dehydrogenase (short-subunit alcohol dehydrogenase family)
MFRSKEMLVAGCVAAKAAKAASNHLNASWAGEFSEYGMRVNCTIPASAHSGLDE